MALLGELAVNLIANTKKFISDFSKTKKPVNAFTKNVDKASSALIALGAGFASFQTVRWIKETTEAMSTNIRFAETLGLTTSRLEGYQNAATRLNVEQGVMNDALLELSKRSAEATTGVGSMFDVMQLMNIDVKEFNRLNLNDKFSRINTELLKIKDTAKRNFFADEIFGGASDEIGGLLPQVKQLADEFERAGLGTTVGAAANILKLEDGIKDLTKEAKQLTKQLFTGLVPALVEAIKGLRIVLEEAGVIRKGREEKKDLASRRFRTPNTPSYFEVPLPQSIRERLVRDLGEAMAIATGNGPAFNNRPFILNERQAAALSGPTPAAIEAMREAMGADRQVY